MSSATDGSISTAINSCPSGEPSANTLPSGATSLLDPVRTLTGNIALEMGYAMGDHRSALFVSGAALLGVGILMNLMVHASAPGGDP